MIDLAPDKRRHAPMQGLSPQGRLACGALGIAALLVAPLHTPQGLGFCAGLLLLWLWACRPSLRSCLATLGMGLALFVPLAALAVLGTSGQARPQALGVAQALFARGTATLFISLGLFAGLDGPSLQEGVRRLPLPPIVRSLLWQIAHQALVLLDETRAIAAAMALRGASGPLCTTGRVLASLPTVWLPRVLERAERVASAMALRGLDGAADCAGLAMNTSSLERRALTVMAAFLLIALALRLAEGG